MVGKRQVQPQTTPGRNLATTARFVNRDTFLSDADEEVLEKPTTRHAAATAHTTSAQPRQPLHREQGKAVRELRQSDH